MAVTDVSGTSEIIDDASVVIPVVNPATPASSAAPDGAWSRLTTQAVRRLIEPWSSLGSGDISGSLGDLGTFLPLTVALVTSVGLDLGTTLIFSGIYNIYSGAAFGVPIPVQPMKSIAAVAITEDGITLDQTLLAGVLVSAAVFTLGATKLIDVANRLVHVSVIRGIQVGIGLKLAIKGTDLVMFVRAGGPWRPWLGAQGLLLGVIAAIYVLLAVVKFQPGRTAGETCCHPASPSPSCSLDHAAGAHACAHPRRTSTHTPSSLSLTASDQTRGHAACGSVCRHACEPPRLDTHADTTTQATAAALQPAGPAASAACDAGRSIGRGCGARGDPSPAAQHSGKPSDCGHEMLPPEACELRCSGRGGRSPRSASGEGDTASGDGSQHAQHAQTRRSICSTARTAARAAAAFPPALLVVLVGIAVTLVDTPDLLGALSFGPATPTLLTPAASDWWPAFSRAALPQLPLTVLNSVIAVTLLSRELFPATPLTMPHVAASVGVMNAVGPWFGCMPCCHGAGGLAAQARFGARTGAAPMLLGAVKLAAGALAGGSLLPLLRAFPQPLLGVLLVLSGAELATTAAKLPPDKRYWLVMMITAAAVMAKDTAVGFAVGLGSAWLVQDWRWPWRAASDSA